MTTEISAEKFILVRDKLTPDNWYHGEGSNSSGCIGCLWTATAREIYGTSAPGVRNTTALESILIRAIRQVDTSSSSDDNNLLLQIFNWNDAQWTVDRIKEVLTAAAEIVNSEG